jgi:hypothetical protein
MCGKNTDDIGLRPVLGDLYFRAVLAPATLRAANSDSVDVLALGSDSADVLASR